MEEQRRVLEFSPGLRPGNDQGGEAEGAGVGDQGAGRAPLICADNRSLVVHVRDALLMTCPEFKLFSNVTKKTQGVQTQVRKVRFVFSQVDELMRQELKNLKLAVNREKELPTKTRKKKGGKNVSSE